MIVLQLHQGYMTDWCDVMELTQAYKANLISQIVEKEIRVGKNKKAVIIAKYPETGITDAAGKELMKALRQTFSSGDDFSYLLMPSSVQLEIYTVEKEEE
jgi:hypothetical protein